MLPVPVTGPLIVSPWTTFEAVALATLKVGLPVRVMPPVNSRP